MTEQDNPFILKNTEGVITAALDFIPDFVFHGNSEEPILKLCANGDIFVKGKKIVNDIEVVEGMRELLKLNKD